MHVSVAEGRMSQSAAQARLVQQHIIGVFVEFQESGELLVGVDFLSLDEELQVDFEFGPPLFDVFRLLDGEEGLARHGRQVGKVELEDCVELVELVVTSLDFPVVAAVLDFDPVKDLLSSTHVVLVNSWQGYLD